MAYIDKAFYDNFSDISISVDEFTKLAERASDIIDIVTFNRIQNRGGISALSDVMQTAIKKATSAQVETMYINGGFESVAGGGGIQSASIGKFNYSVGADTETTINGVQLSPMVNSYLSPTGLLYRGLC